jgi:hypothetical protein
LNASAPGGRVSNGTDEVGEECQSNAFGSDRGREDFRTPDELCRVKEESVESVEEDEEQCCCIAAFVRRSDISPLEKRFGKQDTGY